jgi:hypothetical protein
MLFDLSIFDIIGILIVILLIILVPMMVRRRIMSRVKLSVLELEEMVEKGEKILLKLSQNGKPSQNPEKLIKNFMEYFVIPPVNLDPNGLVRKLDKIMDMSEERFKFMVQELMPDADEEWKYNAIMTLKANLGLNKIAKEVRHNYELAKKTGNLQMLLMLQMSLPLIMRIVKAQFEGIKAFSQGKPIGDGLGPLVVGMIMASDSSEEFVEEGEMIIGRKAYDGRNIIMTRAKGPGARMGKLGKTINYIIEKEGIKRVITIDAAVKLEGEKTGSIAEGVGVVIGGSGVDRWEIEEMTIEEDVILDAIIVKMSPEEAVSPLTKEILEAADKVIPIVEKSILRSKEGTKILVVGVGNSCGLPNIIPDASAINIKEDIENETEE